MPSIASADDEVSATGASYLPDVTGLSRLDARLALATAGFYQLPTDPKDIKNPGSLAKKCWQYKSKRDPVFLRQWEEVGPDAGIAIHTGRSGIVAFDLDVDEIPGELDWLRSGLFQSSRALLLDAGIKTERGHYIFASDTVFVSGPLKCKDGTKVGEVRSGNTIILSQPTTHPHAESKGGGYRWETTGVVPPVPREAKSYLRVHPGVTHHATGGGCPIPVATVAVTSAQAAQWLDTFDDDYEPEQLTAEVERFWNLVDSGDENRHDAMIRVVTKSLSKADARAAFRPEGRKDYCVRRGLRPSLSITRIISKTNSTR